MTILNFIFDVEIMVVFYFSNYSKFLQNLYNFVQKKNLENPIVRHDA